VPLGLYQFNNLKQNIIMIKLTNHFKSKKPVWINSTMIQSIELFTGTRPDETYTNVMATSGATYNVTETPERIVEMMSMKNMR
jgi:hypothetical protein